jgi:dTDP-4-dehydrorhamnose reductase
MKILILGGSGMIGHRMWATLAKTHQVYATLRRGNLGALEKIPGISADHCFFGVDAYDSASLIPVLEKVQPQIVLNCIGIVKQLKDSNDAIKSISLNALFPQQLTKICAQYGARMIQFSSDCVFDGNKGHYVEGSIPDATDIYGRTKTLGEIGDQSHVVTLRTSSIGREVFPHGGLLEWFLSNQDKKVTGYKKAIYSGFPTHRLAMILSEYLFPHPELSGILHIASLPIDKLTLLQMIKSHFNLNIEIGEDSKVEIDRSLDCTHFSKASQFQPPAWSEMMKDLEVDFEIYSQLRRSRSTEN